MKITIQDIITLHCAGRRSENEDSLYPDEDHIGPADRLFVVCDGVGGNPGGERAAQLVARHFAEYLAGYGDAFQSKDLLEDALCFAEQRLDEYAREHPASRGMATTLAYLALTTYGAVIAWVGDSRVMQIREGRIIRQTKDHSLVNALVDFGEITPAEAATHPKRNILLRAVSGRETPATLDVMYVDDILPGDHFLLCTDGVVEGVGDKWPDLLVESFSLEQLRYDIDFLCRKHVADNYSIILLEIGQAAELGSRKDARVSELAPASARVDGPEPLRLSRRRWVYLAPVFVVLILLGWRGRSLLPVGLQAKWIAGSGVMIQNDEHKVLIDAFPLSERVREHQLMGPVRRKILTGARPFDDVELFLVSHPPNLAADSIRGFLKTYLKNHPAVRLHPQLLREQLNNGRPLFQPLGWRAGELNEPIKKLAEHLPLDPASEPGFSVFLLHLTGKTILYAGAPEVDFDSLVRIDAPVDFVLINEWSLRTGAARRTLLTAFPDRSLIVLPSARPMNNRQREEIREALPEARFLNADHDRVRLR